MSNDDIYLTVDEVCTKLRKKRSTLQDWRRRGGGPEYVKTGHRSIVYRLSDVEAWMAKRRFNSTADERTKVQSQ